MSNFLQYVILDLVLRGTSFSCLFLVEMHYKIFLTVTQVYERLASIISMESENSSLNKPSE